MRTVHSSSHLLPGEGLLPGGLLLGGVSQHALGQIPPPVNRMTDRCKNITSFADGNESKLLSIRYPETQTFSQQDSIPVGCVPPASQPYVFSWPPLAVSKVGGQGEQVRIGFQWWPKDVTSRGRDRISHPTVGSRVYHLTQGVCDIITCIMKYMPPWTDRRLPLRAVINPYHFDVINVIDTTNEQFYSNNQWIAFCNRRDCFYKYLT